MLNKRTISILLAAAGVALPAYYAIVQKKVPPSLTGDGWAIIAGLGAAAVLVRML